MAQEIKDEESIHQSCTAGADALLKSEHIDWGPADEESVRQILAQTLANVIETVRLSEYSADNEPPQNNLTWRYNSVRYQCIHMGEILNELGMPLDSISKIVKKLNEQAATIYQSVYGEIHTGVTLHENRYDDIMAGIKGEKEFCEPAIPEKAPTREERILSKVFGKLPQGMELREKCRMPLEEVVITGVNGLMLSFDRQYSGQKNERFQAETYRTSLQIQGKILSCLINDATMSRQEAAELYKPMYQLIEQEALGLWHAKNLVSFDPTIGKPHDIKLGFIFSKEESTRNSLLPQSVRPSNGQFLA